MTRCVSLGWSLATIAAVAATATASSASTRTTSTTEASSETHTTTKDVHELGKECTWVATATASE